MECFFCKWVNKLSKGSPFSAEEFWKYSRRWEELQSNDRELWEAEPQSIKDTNERAADVYSEDRNKSLALYESMAEHGSVWGMRMAARFYQSGWAGDRNLERSASLLSRAVDKGSKIAAVELATVQFHRGEDAQWLELLQQKDGEGFVPASFWLAWYRYRRDPTSQTARAVRPLFDKAVNAGHPGARATLGRLKGRMRYGLAEVIGGYRMHRSATLEFYEEVEARRKAASQAPA